MVQQLEIYVNNTVLRADPTQESLISFLRRHGLTGTKLGCSEGGCGSCTVLVSYYCHSDRIVKNYSCNACLAPASSVHKRHVTTIEGLNSPIQRVLAKSHARLLYLISQCGFCTPGIVMSLYAELVANPTPTKGEIEDAFDGNLCRCTGYRSILDGAKQFGGCTDDCNSCSTSNHTSAHFHSSDKTTDIEDLGLSNLQTEFRDSVIEFPKELLEYQERLSQPECYEFELKSYKWIHCTSKNQLIDLVTKYPEAKLINGNTEVGIEVAFKNMHYPIYIHTTSVFCLKKVQINNDTFTFGALMTVTEFQKHLSIFIETASRDKTHALKAIFDNLKYFAGKQIRNVSAIAGNICTASPISDLNPVLLAVVSKVDKGATLTLESINGIRLVPINQFFTGYRKTALNPGEILTHISVPITTSLQFCESFKQSKRREDDIAIVTAGFFVSLIKDNDDYIILDSCFAYGGMGATTLTSNLEQCYTLILGDLPLSATSPGGMIEYRKTLAQSFFFKFTLRVNQNLSMINPNIKFDDRESSALNEIHRDISRGHQIYQESETAGTVGKAIVHVAAKQQLNGTAVYLDDIPKFHNELHAVIVPSTIPHGFIEAIDLVEALKIPGVVDFISAKDVAKADDHGNPNMIGPVFRDEELFATEKVYFTGQMIGMIVAETLDAAKAAVKKVKITYRELPSLFTCEEAIEQKSFFETIRTLKSGAFADKGEEPLSLATHFVEGVARMSAQEHFYLETQCSLVVPGKEDNEIEIYASTQNPKETQDFVAHVLGISFNRVVCRVKRLGGGFGGKESRSLFVSCGVAVAAKKLNRPVRCVLSREEDMVMSGTRHPFLGQYKVGFTDQGRLISLELEMYANAGYSYDLSIAVLERSLTHAENAYKIPNCKLSGRLCKTNIASNTAFRGFGGPQGMMVAEQYITHVANYLNKSVDEIRKINLYRDGDFTHYDMPLESVYLPQAWEELEKSSDYYNKRLLVNEFNKDNKFRKRGLVMMPTKFGLAFTARFLNQAAALVQVYTDGSVKIAHGGTEMGQGLHTKMCQIAADAFEVPMDRVFISETRTDTCINTSATAASVSSDINGMAVLDACEQIIKRISPLKLLFPLLSWDQIIRKAYLERINLAANGFYKTPNLTYDWATNKGRMFSYFTYGIACTEVEIDTLSGDHVVLSSHVIMDIGRPINPAIDVGQIEGAFTQGLGWSTLEEPLVSPKNGYLHTRGPGLYKIPGFKDIPVDFRVTVMKGVRNTRAIHSSKAVGEPPLFLGASCFYAIREAILAARIENGTYGHFRLDSPSTSERIRLACADSFVLKAATPLGPDEKPWAVPL